MPNNIGKTLVALVVLLPAAALAGVVPPPAAPGIPATVRVSVPPAIAQGQKTVEAGGIPVKNTETNPLYGAALPDTLATTPAASVVPTASSVSAAPAVSSRQATILRQEAAAVWEREHAPVPAQEEPAPRHRISRKLRRVLRVRAFEKAYQGRIYDVPASTFFLTIEATAPILNAVLPPDAHLARAKFLPKTHDRDLMLRFHREAAWHPVQLTLEFAGGLRTLYLLPKPLPIGKTIHVLAPRYVPKVPLKPAVSGNPYSRFLPAVKAVWEHRAVVPGFSAAVPPRHALDYGALKLVPVAAWAGNTQKYWMILWRMVSIDRQTSHISPAQFSGPGILAVSLTGTTVAPGTSPYLLSVEEAGHGG